MAKAKATSTESRVVRFIENLTLVGDYQGQKFRPRDWQKNIVRPIFETRLPDGRRRYRKVFLALPRKQAKTTLTAGIAGYLVFGELQRKRGKRIYSASGDRAQASLIFNTLASMIRADDVLSSNARIYDSYKKIVVDGLDNSYEAVSSEAGLKHGLSPSEVLFDEVHVLPNRQLHDVLTTGFGARREPLAIYITTAGHDRTSICFELWEYARKVRDGIIDDPTFLPILYEADPDDDWTDEAVWRKCMPALGDFCELEFIRDECRRAQQLPAYENTFRQLYLNQWTQQATRWLQTERWASCKGARPLEALVGLPCFAGLDLGVVGDMAALAMLFPNDLGGADAHCRFWVPRDGRWRHESRNKELYELWNRLGFLTFTEGEATDFDQIEQEILVLNQSHPFSGLFADRAYATHLLSRLFNNHGLPVKGIPQGPVTLNEPMVALESMVLRATVRHSGDPVLAWNVSNAVVRRNPTGLMYLDKAAATNRIDGLAALINAIAAMNEKGGPLASVFDDPNWTMPVL